MNVLVTGSKGQLGQEIKKISTTNVYSTQYKFFYTDIYSEPGVDELDITSLSPVKAYIKNNKIAFVKCKIYMFFKKGNMILCLQRY